MIRNKVGQRIKELRLEQGLSQEKLASKSEVNRTYIASVENGKRNISILTLEKIIISLDISFSKFFENM